MGKFDGPATELIEARQDDFRSGLWVIGIGGDTPSNAVIDISNLDIMESGGLQTRRGIRKFPELNGANSYIGYFSPGWTATASNSTTISITVPGGHSLQNESGLVGGSVFAIQFGSNTPVLITSYSGGSSFVVQSAQTVSTTNWKLIYVGRCSLVWRHYQTDNTNKWTLVHYGSRLDAYTSAAALSVLKGNLTNGWDMNAIQVGDCTYLCNWYDLPISFCPHDSETTTETPGVQSAAGPLIYLFSYRLSLYGGFSQAGSFAVNDTSYRYAITRQTINNISANSVDNTKALQNSINSLTIRKSYFDLGDAKANVPTAYADTGHYGYWGTNPLFMSLDDVYAKYTTGTVSTTAASQTVTGSGTLWNTDPGSGRKNAKAGDVLVVIDTTAGTGNYTNDYPYQFYYITAVGTDTSITVDRPMQATLSGKSYYIFQNQAAVTGTATFTPQELFYNTTYPQLSNGQAVSSTAVSGVDTGAFPGSISHGDLVIGFASGAAAVTSAGTVYSSTDYGAAIGLGTNPSGYHVYKVSRSRITRLSSNNDRHWEIGYLFNQYSRGRIDSMMEVRFGGSGSWYPVVGSEERGNTTTTGYTKTYEVTPASAITTVADEGGTTKITVSGVNFQTLGVCSGDSLGAWTGWYFVDDNSVEFQIGYVESTTIIHTTKNLPGNTSPTLAAGSTAWKLRYKGNRGDALSPNNMTQHNLLGFSPGDSSDTYHRYEDRPITEFCLRDQTVLLSSQWPAHVYVYATSNPATAGQTIEFRLQQNGGFPATDTGNTLSVMRGNAPYVVGQIHSVLADPISNAPCYSLVALSGAMYRTSRFAVLRGRGINASPNNPADGAVLYASTDGGQTYTRRQTVWGNNDAAVGSLQGTHPAQGIDGCSVTDYNPPIPDIATPFQLVVTNNGMPIYKFAMWHMGRLWWFNIKERDRSASYPSQVRYSDPDQPEVWSADSFYTVGNSAQEGGLAGAFILNQTMFAIKDRGLYAMTGDLPENITIQSIDPRVSCMHWRTVAVGNSVAYWRGYDNVYTFDGSSVRAIGNQIRPWLDAGTVADKQYSTAVFHKGRYWLCVQYAYGPYGTHLNPKWLIYDPKLDSWTVHDYGASSVFDCDTEHDSGQLIIVPRQDSTVLINQPGQWVTEIDTPGVFHDDVLNLYGRNNTSTDNGKIRSYVTLPFLPGKGDIVSQKLFDYVDYLCSSGYSGQMRVYFNYVDEASAYWDVQPPLGRMPDWDWDSYAGPTFPPYAQFPTTTVDTPAFSVRQQGNVRLVDTTVTPVGRLGSLAINIMLLPESLDMLGRIHSIGIRYHRRTQP